jgi:hypothetical protein
MAGALDFKKGLLDCMAEARKALQSGERMVDLHRSMKDSKLLLRALEMTHKALVLAISAVLKYEHVLKRLSLSKDSEKNLDAFFEKCSEKYGLNDEGQKVMREVFFLAKKHREAGVEFSNNGRAVILDDSLGTLELGYEKLREMIKWAKVLLENADIALKGI